MKINNERMTFSDGTELDCSDDIIGICDKGHLYTGYDMDGYEMTPRQVFDFTTHMMALANKLAIKAVHDLWREMVEK